MRLRLLDLRITENGYMCGTTVMIPGAFKGEALSHYMTKNYIRIDSCRIAWKWDGQPCRCSWYGLS